MNIRGNLEIPSLLETLSRRLRLEDYGDPRFMKGLEALVQSAAKEHTIHPVGRWILKRSIIHYLTNRLLIQETIKERPEILGGEVSRPIFIVGPSRTGTLLLQNLLALAPGARAPRLWELNIPAPPCVPGSWDERRRLRKAKTMLWLVHRAAPRFRYIHPVAASDFEECYFLLNHTFSSPAFLYQYGLPRYAIWLSRLDKDHEQWVYREYLTQLKILQAGAPPGHWVLKSAAHLYFLDALLDVIPGALLVQTHRDPRQMLPSLCSLITCFRKLVHAPVDPKAIGPECKILVKSLLERGYRARKNHPETPVVDVHFDALVANPVEQVRSIHERFDLGWDPAHERRMKDWLDSHPPYRYGKHRYHAEQFGLDEESLTGFL